MGGIDRHHSAVWLHLPGQVRIRLSLKRAAVCVYAQHMYTYPCGFGCMRLGPQTKHDETEQRKTLTHLGPTLNRTNHVRRPCPASRPSLSDAEHRRRCYHPQNETCVLGWQWNLWWLLWLGRLRLGNN